MNIKETLRKYLPSEIWKTLIWAKHKWLIFKYINFGRPYYAGETTKAHSRRQREGFFDLYCKGKGLDIGFGGDPISIDVDGFDFEHGDAQFLSNVKDDNYDFVYSSHTIEHLPDPYTAVQNWFRVLKPGGYLILYMPHRDLYEKKKTLPSIFNPTHFHFFLPDRDEEPDTIGVLPLIERSINNYKLIYLKVCDAGLNIMDPLIHSNGEYSIEVVLKKME